MDGFTYDFSYILLLAFSNIITNYCIYYIYYFELGVRTSNF